VRNHVTRPTQRDAIGNVKAKLWEFLIGLNVVRFQTFCSAALNALAVSAANRFRPRNASRPALRDAALPRPMLFLLDRWPSLTAIRVGGPLNPLACLNYKFLFGGNLSLMDFQQRHTAPAVCGDLSPACEFPVVSGDEFIRLSRADAAFAVGAWSDRGELAASTLAKHTAILP
jgi:hypothetical protein